MNGANPFARDQLLNDLSSTLSPKSPSEAAPPQKPPSIPDHELIRCIGRGSYGEVWLARSVMGVWRAVKIIFRRSFDHDRPFERELEGIRRFEPVSRTHPSQLNVLHVGRKEAEGCFYYVMELADSMERSGGIVECGSNEEEELVQSSSRSGLLNATSYTPRTLRSELLRRGRLPFEECVHIGLALATALNHLHRHGLVHRDIKPSNIVFVNSIPKLADIGLVAAAEATLSVVGTEGYLPPEGPGTPQADIFSLGKVLYEMATGRDRQEFPELPTNLIEQSDAERAQLAELNEIIVKACHADLKQRYQTAADLHADLALLQSGKSINRIRTTERRLRLAQRAGALVTLIAAIAAGLYVWQAHQTQAMRELAETKARLVVEKSELADTHARLAEENRQRIVRLDVANGIRLLDDGDPSAALLWFADALPLVTNQSAEESIHRIRIQQTLDQTPRVLCVLPHEDRVGSSAFSPDGRLVATGTWGGSLRVWNAKEGSVVWGPKGMGAGVSFVRFSRDGQRLFASASDDQLMFNGAIAGNINQSLFYPNFISPNFLAVLDAPSGQALFPTQESSSELSTNLICAYFSPDDRWLAVALKGQVIRVFDLVKKRIHLDLRGHSNEVVFLSFSADGGLLASASLDRTVRLWHLPSGELAGPPLEHRWPVVRALLSEDGQWLISASFANPPGGESEVQAWKVSTGERLDSPIKGRDYIAMFMGPANHGQFLVQDGLRKGLFGYQFNSPTGAITQIEMGGVHCWDFNKAGDRLALGTGEYLAQVFDVRTSTSLAGPFRHSHHWVMAVKFSPDESQLLTACSDGNARLWDLRTARIESARHTLPSPIRLRWTSNWAQQLGRTRGLVSLGLQDGTVRIFNDQLKELQQFSTPEPGMEVMNQTSAHHSNMWAFSPYHINSNASPTVFLWQQEGEAVRQFTLQHPDVVHYEIFFTLDDRYLVTYCKDRLVRFWRTSDGQLDRTIEIPKIKDGNLFRFSPDGKTALWGQLAPPGSSCVEWIQFFDLETRKHVGQILEQPGTLSEFIFSPDGQQVAFMGQVHGSVMIVEARTGRVISSSIAHSSSLDWVQWAPDSRRLLTAGGNDEVLIWEARAGIQLLGPLRMPNSEIHKARWSSDNMFIVTRSDDNKVRVWDATTGEAITPMLPHEGAIAFSIMANGNRLISASHPNLLRAWDLKETSLSPDILADYAKLLSGRRLNSAGVMLVLRPGELAGINHSLRVRAPQLFE